MMKLDLVVAPAIFFLFVLICGGLSPIAKLAAEVQAPSKQQPSKATEASGDSANEIQPVAAESSTTHTVDLDDSVIMMLNEYLAAFNRHDSKLLAEYWSENGVFVDEESGERIAGRAAIEVDLAQLFEENNQISLSVSLDEVRVVRPDVVQITGQAISLKQEGESHRSKFSAILVHSNGRWLFDSINETALPAAPSFYEHLKVLEPLIGHWVDDSGGEDNSQSRVDTIIRWSANRSFLVRSFTIESSDGTREQGTQVIGWDPLRKTIRCWTFNSDGSFGEGTWTPKEDGWVVKVSQTLADGRRAGGTQIITRVNDLTLTVQTVGIEIEGKAQPASVPVTVTRIGYQEED